MSQIDEIPSCEKYIHRMFDITLIPFINTYFYKPLPLFASTILIGSVFSPLYYSNYYLFEPILYSIDLFIAFIAYNYLMYKYLSWQTTSCFEHTSIDRITENTSLFFYSIFMLYWLYDAFIQFGYHTEKDILIQIGNIYMSVAWYFYFSICSLLYYFICIKLAQRTQSINIWLKSIKRSRPNIEEFYKSYKIHHKAIKVFGKHWNFVVFMGFIILTYHIPIDLVNILYNNRYTDIAGVIIKSLSLIWYIYQICLLNNKEKQVIYYLYKHELFSTDEMTRIEKYSLLHELGLNFYGIKIDGSLIIRLGLITVNLIVPTVYALLSNKLIRHYR